MHRVPGLRVLVGLCALALFAAGCASSNAGVATDATLKPEGATTTTSEDATTTASGPEPSTEPTAPPSSGSTPTTSGTPTAQLTLEETVPLVVQSLDEYWGRTFPAVIANRPYETISDVKAVRSRNPRIECGGEVINDMILANGGNALYCSDGDYIAYDARGLIPELYSKIGDMAVLVAFAHEWGHAIAERARYELTTTIGAEQQADCFAGAWAGDLNAGTNKTLSLSPDDLDEALTGLLILRDPPTVDPLSEGAHGSAFQRIDAFRKGFEGGAAACVDLFKQPPVNQGTDTEEGDLGLAELIPLTTQALDLYWAPAFTQVGGSGTYTPFRTTPFRGAASPPACDGLTADEIVGHIVYCPSGDFVSWDEELVDDLYGRGDFAVSAAIADAWSAGILQRLKAQGDARTLGLEADCLAGAWTGALSNAEVLDSKGDPILVLSAGDLDEAVAGFLLQSGTADADASFDTDTTSAFDRTAAFQKGFENQARSCLG